MAAVTAINNLGACAHNPRGNLWFNDESTYGHKLLMKMGWSKGKGLGKNEDGIKQNLSVKFKNTNSGLGYKDNPYANVMKTEYESILKNLNSSYSQKEVNKQEKKNCEQQSKVVKSRIRYPKLFFGKDVTKYSEQDMKSIFICSLPSNDNEEVVPEDSALLQKQKSDVALPKVAETTYSSTLSISDYFAKKMEEKKSNMLTETASTDRTQQQPSLDTEISKVEKINSDTDPGCINDSNLQQTCLKLEDLGATNKLTILSTKKSSKKKKNKSNISIDEMETDSPYTTSKEHECLVPNKRKRKISEDLAPENNATEIQIYENDKITNIDSYSPDRKRRKCDTKKDENNSVDALTNDVDKDKIPYQIDLSSNKTLQPKKKRKKCHKEKHPPTDTEVGNSLVAIDISMLNCTSELSNTNIISPEKKKKKKKKLKMKLNKLKSCLKSKTNNYSIKNVSFAENVSYRIIDTDYESVECISDTCGMIQNDLINKEVNSNNEGKSESVDNTSDSQKVCSGDDKCNSNSVTEVKEIVADEDLRESCSLSSLPSPKSSHFNYWIESQRQALKMKLYKSMLKSIKKHKVLKTSNLLSIKGYGNWGF